MWRLSVRGCAVNAPPCPALPSRERTLARLDRLYLAIGEHGWNQLDQLGLQLLKFVTSTVDDWPTDGLLNVVDAIVHGLSCQVEDAVVLR